MSLETLKKGDKNQSKILCRLPKINCIFYPDFRELEHVSYLEICVYFSFSATLQTETLPSLEPDTNQESSFSSTNDTLLTLKKKSEKRLKSIKFTYVTNPCRKKGIQDSFRVYIVAVGIEDRFGSKSSFCDIYASG